MNNCINNYNIYSRREEKKRGAFSAAYALLLAICEMLVEIFESRVFKVALRFVSAVAIAAGAYLFVSAILGGSLGFVSSLLCVAALVGSSVIVFKV